VLRRIAARKEVGQADLHRLGNFCQGFQRRDCVAVFHAGKIAAQQARAALDVALRQSAVAPVGSDHFTDVDLGFLFRQWLISHPRVFYGAVRVGASALSDLVPKRKPAGTSPNIKYPSKAVCFPGRPWSNPFAGREFDLLLKCSLFRYSTGSIPFRYPWLSEPTPINMVHKGVAARASSKPCHSPSRAATL